MARGKEREPAQTLMQQWGSELRRYRETAGLTQLQLGKLVGYSESAVGMFETAERVMTPETAEACDEIMKTGGSLAGWLPFVIKDVPSWFTSYLELERKANSLRIFEPQVVPGLLQTDAYARAVLEAGRHDSIEVFHATRMSRQLILEREDPLHLWVVMEQSVLERNVGGPEVISAQLQRLVEHARKPRIVLQVIPKSVPCHAGLDGNLHILSFPEGPDMVYQDGHANGRLIVKTQDVAHCNRTYDLLRAVAASPEESIRLLIARIEELAP